MRSSPVCTLAVLALAACGPGNNGQDGGVPITCQNDPRVMTFAPNLTATEQADGGGVRITLLNANPAPPARYTNDWQVSILDGSGAPVSNASLTVVPYMPDHGHGTQIPPVVTPESSGTYDIGSLYFFMPGVWRTTITVPVNDQNHDVLFWFCIPG